MAKRFLLVDSDVLPDVFMKVVRAKELLASVQLKICLQQRRKWIFPAVRFINIKIKFLM